MPDTKKRKNDITEDGVVAKKRKIEVNDIDDGDDVSIIENNDVHHDASSELKKSKKVKSSEDLDCLIVYDDKNND